MIHRMFKPWIKAGALALGLAAVLGCVGCASFWRAEPYEETLTKRGFHWFLRPARHEPDAQMRYAEELREAGRLRAASRQYRALVVFWPESSQAPKAQLRYAETLERRGNPVKAFDEYQYLFQKFPGRFPYDTVIGRQYTIATNLMYTRKARFFGLPGFLAPERAIPYFEKIATNAPAWDKAAEMQFLTGKAYELSLQYELAVGAYLISENRFPDSLFAERACFGRVYCLYQLAQESAHYEPALNEATAAALLFLRRYPKSPHRELVQSYKQTLDRQRAKAIYDIAWYYDHYAKKPAAALISYDMLVKLFPDSAWAEPARQRIQALRPSTGDTL